MINPGLVNLGQPWSTFIPGALLGVVGGSGVLKGSKGTGSKLKEVEARGREVTEVVLLDRLEVRYIL